MPPSSPTKKSSNLTLAQLVSHDDVLTDALVDHVYYWTTIRKNRPRYIAARSLKEEQIAEIIRTCIIRNKDVQLATKKVEALPFIKSYMARLKSSSDKDHFRRHLEKYILIYSTDCAFEVTTTNRYTIFSHEASVTARKPIKAGEKIKYLTGHQVEMSKEDEAQLELTQRNFSIVFSSRKKTQSLFLGPARFANHDCNANSRLTPVGQYGMEVVARRFIAIDEEITVSYGDDYFGENNCDCLCSTCEKLVRNGWNTLGLSRPEFTSTPDLAPSIEVTDLGYSLRSFKTSSKRKYLIDSTDLSRDVTPDPKRRRTATPRVGTLTHEKQEANTQKAPSSLANQTLISDVQRSRSPSKSRSQPPSPQAPPSTSRPVSPPASRPVSQPASRAASRPTSRAASPVPVREEFPSTDDCVPETVQEIKVESLPTRPRVSGTEVSEDSVGALSVKSTPPTSIETESMNEAALLALTGVRIPRDYLTNKGLLAESHSGWVLCQTCDNKWIQQNAYEPRVSCPRCERHSKLHGFEWPKTEREGTWDKEEQVLDHREVARVAGKRKKWDIEVKPGEKVEYSGIWKGWKTQAEKDKEKAAKAKLKKKASAGKLSGRKSR